MKTLLKMINQTIEKYLIPVLTYLLALFMPVAKMMFGIGFFVTIDLATGIMAAKKKGEQEGKSFEEVFQSRRIRDTVTKGTSYMLAILVALVVQRLFLPDFEVVKIISGLIAFIELKSIDENFKTITGKSLLGKLLKTFNRD